MWQLTGEEKEAVSWGMRGNRGVDEEQAKMEAIGLRWCRSTQVAAHRGGTEDGGTWDGGGGSTSRGRRDQETPASWWGGDSLAQQIGFWSGVVRLQRRDGSEFIHWIRMRFQTLNTF